MIHRNNSSKWGKEQKQTFVLENSSSTSIKKLMFSSIEWSEHLLNFPSEHNQASSGSMFDHSLGLSSLEQSGPLMLLLLMTLIFGGPEGTCKPVVEDVTWWKSFVSSNKMAERRGSKSCFFINFFVPFYIKKRALLSNNCALIHTYIQETCGSLAYLSGSKYLIFWFC